VLLALAFLTRDSELSRKFLLGYVVIMSLVLTLANMYFRRSSLSSFGESHADGACAEAGRSRSCLKCWPRGASRSQDGGLVGDGESCGIPLGLLKLSGLAELRRILQEQSISQVIISQHSFSPEKGRQIAQCAEEAGCRVRFSCTCKGIFPTSPSALNRKALSRS